MNQSELNRAVAKATGESVSMIAEMGFVPLANPPYERESRTVDWDEADASRNVSLNRWHKRLPPVV